MRLGVGAASVSPKQRGSQCTVTWVHMTITAQPAAASHVLTLTSLLGPVMARGDRAGLGSQTRV